jgi:RHS repeat-associated protein
LSGISGNGINTSYKYNDGGIRTQKTVNGVTTTYYLEGDLVVYEESYNVSSPNTKFNKIYYTYTGDGSLVSMNLDGVEYYYIRNAQEDIIGLYDKDGTQVAGYTYDTWGKLISIKDQNGIDVTNDKASIGYKNAYRYRGYRYDTGTGLYYLNSRYYNPEWGRFINVDGILGTPGELLSHNMYAYCLNNPINMSDPSGRFGFSALFNNIAQVVVAAVAVVTAIVQSPVILATVVVGVIILAGITIYKGIQLYKIKSAASSSVSEKEVTDAGKLDSKSWNDAKKKIKEGRGKGVNVKARSEEEAERLIKEAKPELERRPTYEADPPKLGYEVHPVDNEYDMPHIKWRDWSNGKANGADGHIFWDN